jgi:hypothetical protein
MQGPTGTASRGHRTSFHPTLADSPFKEQMLDNAELRCHLEQEAAHWGRLLELMEGRHGRDSMPGGKKVAAKACHSLELLRTHAGALIQRLADLDKEGVDFSTDGGRRSVKRAVCELLATFPEPNDGVPEALHAALRERLVGCRPLNVRNGLALAIKHLGTLRKRVMMPAGCYWGHQGALVLARSESSREQGRFFGLSLLSYTAGCALEGRGEDLRMGLKALAGLYAENRMQRESLSMLSIQLLAQCQVASLAAFDDMPQDIVWPVLDLLKQFRDPLLSRVESDIRSMWPEDPGSIHEEPSLDSPVTVPLYMLLLWLARSVPNGLREGVCHAIALLMIGWAISSAIEAFVGAVGGHAWPPASILGLVVILAFIGFDRFFQKKIVDRQAFRPQADAQFGRYAKSKCFNLMRWTSLVQPWFLPIGFFVFGLAAFDAQARSHGGTGFNDTSALQPEALQGSLLSSNASQCEIAAAMAMSTERIGYAWQCALIPVQAQIIGLFARPFRDLLQSGTRSRWTSGLSLCRCIINAQGRKEFFKLTDDEQWRVWLLRDILYAVSSVGTLGIGQAYGKGLISLIQLRTCLAHEAIGIEFKSVYGPMNEALDGFWPDLASKLVEWCPALVGLESPSDQPLVCVVDRQPCIVGDEHGWQKFREHFARNALARVATASVGNDASGALATLCNRLGYPELEAFFLIVGSLLNAATGATRARTANYLADPHKCPHPDTVTRLAEVIVTRGSSASMTPLTPREREIREGLEKRHAIAGAFKSGISDNSDASSASTPPSTVSEDSSRQEDYADESSQ